MIASVRSFLSEARTSETITIVTLAATALVASQIIFSTIGGGQYISVATLCLQYFAFLLVSAMSFSWRRDGNVFTLLLIFVFGVFFYIRPTTIMLFPYSAVLLRHKTGQSEFLAGYLVSVVGAVSLFAGITMATGLAKMQSLKLDRIGGRAPILTLVLIMTVVLIGAHASSFLCNTPSWLHYTQLFFDPNLLCICALLLAYELRDNRPYQSAITAIFLAVFIFLRVAAGSRSGVYSVLYAGLVIYGVFGPSALNYTKNKALGVIIVIPLAVILSVSAFSLGDYFRSHSPNFCQSDPDVIVGPPPSSAEIAVAMTSISYAKVAERLGGVDNTIDLVENPGVYKSIISLDYYVRSILDGLIVGSLHGKEVLRASIMLKTAYDPSKLATVYDPSSYQSDLVTPFAELMILGGWLGLVGGCALAGIAAGAVWVWASADKLSAFRLYVLLVGVAVWWQFLNSYGLDWVVLDSVRQTVLLTAFFAGWIVVHRLTLAVGPRLPANSERIATDRSDGSGI